MNLEMINIKNDLVERLGVFLERKDQLAPVAARILSYVILTGKSGTTFDDLVINLGASKSTISTHLTHLQNLKKLVYFTKTGDRKKYFVLNQDTIIQSMNLMIEQWNEQKNLHAEIKLFKEKVNQSLTAKEYIFDLEFDDNFIAYLNEAIHSVSLLKNKIIANQTSI